MSDKEKIKEELKRKFYKGEFGWHYNKDKSRQPELNLDSVEEFLLEALSRQKEELINEMVKLSDKIEAEVGTPDIEEWKAFKHFRNTMRDKIKH